jgi:polyisoprenyl-teichoic acid--peptidoglycan teichoic acid transferase
LTRRKLFTVIIALLLLITSAAGLWLLTTGRAAPPLDALENPAPTDSYEYAVPALEEPPPPAEPENQVNILLLGLDIRGLSDAIMIVSYNTETFESSAIALKRDTNVSFQTWSEPGMGHSALGWASYVGMGYGGSNYRGGAEYMASTIEELLGIKIHNYASITFEGFVQLVDLIGGVTVDIAPGFAESKSSPLTPGRRHLNGEEALIYARHRTNPRITEPGSLSEDGDRIRRNQRLLQAVLEQCKTLTPDELILTFELLDQKIHTNMDDWDLLTIANIFYNKDPHSMELVVLPGEIVKVYESQLESEIEYYFLDREECDSILAGLGLK